MLLRPWVFFMLCFLMVACSEPRPEQGWSSARPGVQTTFEKFLLKAERGDAEAQNLIGYMLYFGEGVERDRANAQFWFERAAVQAHHGAQLNLAVMLYTGAGAPRDPDLAVRYYNRWRAASGTAQDGTTAQPKSIAETITRIRNTHDKAHAPAQTAFERFCAGCHGLNGIAAYVSSPSFAIKERLHKEDRKLLASITAGHGVMPAWGGLLDERKRRAVLEYIRTFPARFNMGIALPLRHPPEHYFTFGPMRDIPLTR